LGFAKYFYQALANGEAVGPALRRARGTLAEAGRPQSLTWANYMLYGEPGAAFSAARAQDSHQTEHFARKRIFSNRLANNRPSVAFIFSMAAVLLLIFAYAGYSTLYRKLGPLEAESSSITESSVPRAALTVPAAPLSLTMNLIGQRKEPDGQYIEVVVKEGSVLRSGDQFQVQVETNKPCHLFVLFFDSHGQTSQLFPDPKMEKPGFIKAGQKIAVPDKDLWFRLDEHTGTETVYALVSEEPLSDIAGLLRKMEKAAADDHVRPSHKHAEAIQIVQRRAGGSNSGKAATVSPRVELQRVKKVTDVVASAGAVIRAISFEHRKKVLFRKGI
jgi:hypothetical protein